MALIRPVSILRFAAMPLKPVFVRCVLDQEPAVIPRPIIPPGRAALSQRHFGSVNRFPGKGKPAWVFGFLCSRDSPTGVHKFFSKGFPPLAV